MGQTLEASQSTRDSFVNGTWIIESAVFKQQPGEPALGDEHVGRGLKPRDQGRLGTVQGANLFVGRQCLGAKRGMFGKPVADQSRQVRRHRLDPHGTEVNESRQTVTLEKEMFGTRIAEAGLKWNHQLRRITKTGEDLRYNLPRQLEPAQTGVNVFPDCLIIKRGADPIETIAYQRFELGDP